MDHSSAAPDSRSSDEPFAPTTTHADWGAGDPHLRFAGDRVRPDYRLEGVRVRIGSAADADLRLEDTEALHAEIVHDDRDEFVLVLHAPAETSGQPSPQPSTQEPGLVLRTGSAFTIGPWTLVFARDEFADHGRPFGGRQGGEGAIQPDQPRRPDYSAEVRAATAREQ